MRVSILFSQGTNYFELHFPAESLMLHINLSV